MERSLLRSRGRRIRAFGVGFVLHLMFVLIVVSASLLRFSSTGAASAHSWVRNAFVEVRFPVLNGTHGSSYHSATFLVRYRSRPPEVCGQQRVARIHDCSHMHAALVDLPPLLAQFVLTRTRRA